MPLGPSISDAKLTEMERMLLSESNLKV